MPKHSKSSKGRAKCSSPPTSPLQSPLREPGGRPIRLYTTEQQDVCKTCMNSTMAGLCTKIGHTAFHIASTLECECKKTKERGKESKTIPTILKKRYRLPDTPSSSQDNCTSDGGSFGLNMQLDVKNGTPWAQMSRSHILTQSEIDACMNYWNWEVGDADFLCSTCGCVSYTENVCPECVVSDVESSVSKSGMEGECDEIQDHFDINFAPRLNTKKRKNHHGHADNAKDRTGKKSSEGMSQRFEHISKRLLKKDGHMSIVTPQAFYGEKKLTTIDLPEQTDSSDFCRQLVSKRVVSWPSSKGVPSLLQEFDEIVSRSHKTCLLPTESQFEGTHSIPVSDLETTHITEEEQRKELDCLFDAYPSEVNLSDEESGSLWNLVGSSASLEVDVVYELSPQREPKETPSENQWAAKQSDSDCNIPFVDDQSTLIEAKFINPVANASLDSLYGGSTLSVELSDETIFVGECDPDANLSNVNNSAEGEWFSKSSRSSPKNVKERQSDETNKNSMCIGEGCHASLMGCDGASEWTLSKSASYDDNNCPRQEMDKDMYLQERLLKSPKSYGGLAPVPEATKGHHRKSQSHARHNAVNKLKSDVKGGIPEGIKKGVLNDLYCTCVHEPNWPKLKSLASKILDICAEQDQSTLLKAADVHAEERIQRMYDCIKKLRLAMVSQNEPKMAENSE